MVLSSEEEDNEKEKEENSLLNQVYSLLNSSGGLDQLVAECEAVNAYRGNNYLPLIWRFYKSHRRAFFRLINTLNLQSTTNDCRLMNAVKFLLDNAHRRGEWLKGEVDLSFASAQLLTLLIVIMSSIYRNFGVREILPQPMGLNMMLGSKIYSLNIISGMGVMAA